MSVTLQLNTALAGRYEIEPEIGRAEVATSIEPWRTDAARIGISARDSERMESAFEHSDVTLARGWG